MTKLSERAREALAAQKDVSLKETRQKLEDALQRLAAGTSAIAPAGAKISATNVAKEAGIDRATLYRFHQPVLEEIQRLAGSGPKAKLKQTKENLDTAESRLKEYRTLVEEAQGEVTALARINYRLDARVQELEDALRVRDKLIEDLRAQLSAHSGSPSSPVPLHRKEGK